MTDRVSTDSMYDSREAARRTSCLSHMHMPCTGARAHLPRLRGIYTSRIANGCCSVSERLHRVASSMSAAARFLPLRYAVPSSGQIRTQRHARGPGTSSTAPSDLDAVLHTVQLSGTSLVSQNAIIEDVARAVAIYAPTMALVVSGRGAQQ